MAKRKQLGEDAIGKKARDTITGLVGIITARTVWLNGCVGVTLQPQEPKDGVPIEAQWFDDAQVEIVDAGVQRVANGCGSCTHYRTGDDDADGYDGRCVRFPPSTGNPLVDVTDYCGEFEDAAGELNVSEIEAVREVVQEVIDGNLLIAFDNGRALERVGTVRLTPERRALLVSFLGKVEK